MSDRGELPISPSEQSWSDCPVVFFAAPTWRLKILAELIREAGCGLGTDRDMLTVYARSIRDAHRLADLIVRERTRFRKRPDSSDTGRARPRASAPRGEQLTLPEIPG